MGEGAEVGVVGGLSGLDGLRVEGTLLLFVVFLKEGY